MFIFSAGVAQPSVATAVVGCIYVLSAIIAVFLIDCLGKRKLLILSISGCLVAFLGLTISFILRFYQVATAVMAWLCIVFIVMCKCSSSIWWLLLTTSARFFLVMAFFAWGLGPIGYSIFSELFPPEIMSTLLFYCCCSCCLKCV